MQPSTLFGIVCASIALLFVALPTHGADEQLPDWARPTPGPITVPAPVDDGLPHHVPGSNVSYTEQQLANSHLAKDWFPDEHPPMPPPVAGGADAKVPACAACHLPNGTGHPESAALAGLSAKYIVTEVAAIVGGTRQVVGTMKTVAADFTPAEIQQAADYYAALHRVPSVSVVETATVPATHVLAGSMRLPLPDAPSEPIGERIIELPQSVPSVLNHDPHAGFVAYVPAGSIAAGRTLVQGGNGVIACAACHAAGLHGIGDTPWIAGRSPTYVYRQLWDFKHGTRNAPADAPMKAVAANLRDDQMIAIAAYLGTLKP
jgi:cytochrome c553